MFGDSKQTVNAVVIIFLISLWANRVSCDDEMSKLLCNKDSCQGANCTAVPIHCSVNNATHAGKSMLDPSSCNCCEYCLVFLLEGDECSQGGLGIPPTGNVCGPGLTCQTPDDESHATCQRLTSPCHDAQDDYDERRQNGTLGITEQRPECDEDGLFGHKYCVPGQTCFCRNSDGERIFGEVLNEKNAGDALTCRCSRVSDSMYKLLSDNHGSMRCNTDGSFDPMQCIGRRCFCVNPATGAMSSARVVDSMSQPLTDLPCFDSSIHHSRTSYHRLCEEEVFEMKQEIARAEAEGYSYLGNPFPNCQLDGWFAPVMKKDDRFLCVDPFGNQLEKYEAMFNSKEAENIDCKCARTEYLMKRSQAANVPPNCCPNGNWNPVQCRGNVCYCVNSDGVQQGMEVEATIQDTLPCYDALC